MASEIADTNKNACLPRLDFIVDRSPNCLSKEGHTSQIQEYHRAAHELRECPYEPVYGVFYAGLVFAHVVVGIGLPGSSCAARKSAGSSNVEHRSYRMAERMRGQMTLMAAKRTTINIRKADFTAETVVSNEMPMFLYVVCDWTPRTIEALNLGSKTARAAVKSNVATRGIAEVGVYWLHP